MNVATRRAYGQYCGLARGLELVGERWALLIVRDLLVGPRRFTDLRRGLPRIPTNVLSDRLKELEDSGVVQRRVLPRPSGSVVYELTQYGQQLEGVVVQLGLWGAQSLGDPRPDEILTTDSMIMALRSTFRPDLVDGLRARFELRLGEIVIHADVHDGSADVGAGPSSAPDLVIETGPTIRAVLAGDISATEAVSNGWVHLTGEAALFRRFSEVFQIPRKP